jgi:outer membrane protein OmpA-like peptidoglycan-associated protein
LIDKGIDPARLKAIGKGETEPRASNDSQEGMLMNRRVEIEIIHGRKFKPRKK